jgi:hypothetical protein
LVFASAGCDCAGFGRLEVGGPTPYARCLAAAPPDPGEHRVGRATLRFDEHELRITGLPSPARIAAFAGPALGPAPDAATMAALTEAKPDLVFVLGGLGDDAVTAAATAQALATLSVPTFVVAGGRDTRERIADALRAASTKDATAVRHVVDVSALHAIRLGRDTFVPIAGASFGRYAIEPRACGFGLDDLKARASALGAPAEGERRWLLAWEAPGAGGPFAVARTATGLDTGSGDLAELARRVGAHGGLFAWPDVRVLRPAGHDGAREVPAGTSAPDLELVVPRLAGPAHERDDGTRVLPGFVVLRLDASGLAIEAVRAFE